MTNWYLSNLTLVQGMLISIPLAISVQMALRSGVFSFASIGFYGVGAYGTGILVLRDWPPFAAVTLMILLSVAVAYAMSAPLIRLRGLYLGMVTFAFDLILSVVAVNGGDLTGGALGLSGVPLSMTTGGLLIVAIVAVLLVSQFERGTVGRSMAGIRVSEELIQSVGIDVKRRKKAVFAISAGLGALSGSMYILTFSYIAPTTASFTLIITTLTMAVIGGVSSWVGAVLGTAIITFLPSLVNSSGDYQHLLYGVVLVLVVMYAPDGVLGLLRSASRFVRSLIVGGSGGRASGGRAHSPEPDTPEPAGPGTVGTATGGRS